MCLYLLMKGIDYKTANNCEKQPGDDTPDVKLFMADVLEEYRCFGQLDDEQETRLYDLFNELDYSGEGFIANLNFLPEKNLPSRNF